LIGFAVRRLRAYVLSHGADVPFYPADVSRLLALLRAAHTRRRDRREPSIDGSMIESE
jgi:hypothetical protein